MAEGTDAKERLARTIAALGKGDYAEGLSGVQEGVPWGLAYAVSVQKETVGKGRAVRGLERPKQGQHPGPSALLKHRTGSPSKAETGPPAFDPFGRAALRVTNPVEVAWRSTVAATIPEPLPLRGAAAPAGSAVAAAVSAAATGGSLRNPAHGGSVKPAELMQTVAANLGWGSSPMRLTEVPEAFWKTVSPEVHSQIAEYLFER
ncbi:hypothetical protein VOLCADRAFT_116368, partial [Volvox carteri f. nagariensis]